jgi:hypothetical protein
MNFQTEFRMAMRNVQTIMWAGSVILCGTLLSGCASKISDEDDASVPVAKAEPLGQSSQMPSSKKIREATERVFGGMRFKIPAGWDEKSLTSDMLLGEFILPGDTGPGRLTLSTAGGGTGPNMDRWRGQFQPGPGDSEPSESKIAAAGKDVTLLEIQGTFSDTFGGGGPKRNWMLLGAAIPIDADHNYFVKLTGPKETVKARRDEFLKFIESARLE